MIFIVTFLYMCVIVLCAYSPPLSSLSPACWSYLSWSSFPSCNPPMPLVVLILVYTLKTLWRGVLKNLKQYWLLPWFLVSTRTWGQNPIIENIYYCQRTWKKKIKRALTGEFPLCWLTLGAQEGLCRMPVEKSNQQSYPTVNWPATIITGVARCARGCKRHKCFVGNQLLCDWI